MRTDEGVEDGVVDVAVGVVRRDHGGPASLRQRGRHLRRCFAAAPRVAVGEWSGDLNTSIISYLLRRENIDSGVSRGLQGASGGPRPRAVPSQRPPAPGLQGRQRRK